MAKEMGRPSAAIPLAEEAYHLATGHGLTPLAQQIKPVLESARSKLVAAATVLDATPSTPHAAADADRAAAINISYRHELARWKALPWWRRLTVRKPKPPPGALA